MNRLLIFIFSISFIMNCRGNILYWQHMPNPVFDSKNNFIKIYLPKEFSDETQRLSYKEYMIAVLREEKGTVFERSVLINPDRGLNFFKLWNNHEQFRFPAGCELVFPIYGGENKYEVRLGKYLYGYTTKIFEDINLSENKSLRITLHYKGFPYPEPKNWDERQANAGHTLITLTASIESSFLESNYEKCKF
ncbi:hypothetical protein [Leptospira saintgironsiae]|uniref:hypothetical protein n=1 Tax=Leptospira saintgironsiae TaxID=2023183 RepID=UPI001FCBED14|nr:hypothetical protein [Leptospira saintgironsiae]